MGIFTRLETIFSHSYDSAEKEDVVNAIAFLLSDQSAMINCVTLPVDGGFLAC